MSPRATGGPLQMSAMLPGTEIASYHTYTGTQAAVDLLSDEEFDVKPITIVGADLHLVERVTDRLTTTKAALPGASSGVLWGAFMRLMMSSASANQSAFLWVLFGIVGGVLAGAFTSGPLYAATGGRRDLTSQSQVVASCYVVLVSAGISQAFELLQRSPGNQMRPCPVRRRPEPEGPSEYGSHSDEKPHFGVRLNDEGKDGGAEASGDNEHAVPAQGFAETAVESTEDSRKPLD